ncbi:hypothetical protein FHR92_002462 [Fontibacillus solani]|uniref:Uncharacterized protein n=1 Tax=Fontibacillus solani TaxID=1572857 RepID=A0A7W3STP6_9BACL|nr:hypothetical protein [Fontibacillus solani]MBA9085990.1 hypothetical protein [Fontibacillus solani]
MGKHTLVKGKVVLRTLKELGEALNYHVESEFPVKKGINKQAIDIAWFIDDNDIKYPIMIFEVESYSANGSSANPMKIFSKPNDEFEKPMFFFHLFVDSGNDPAVITDLEHQFGRNNYRIYEIKKGDLERLILDVISQHRRINYNININSLVEFLVSGRECEEFALNRVLSHLESLYKHKWNELLPIYAYLAQCFPVMNNEFVRFLDRKITSDMIVDDLYEDFIAFHFSYAVHLSILTCVKETSEYIPKLKWWQEESSYMERIGPYFGLSRDYDDFITSYSGAYFGLLAALLKEQPAGVKYILKQCIKILNQLNKHSDNVVFYNSLWALHIAASSIGCETEYDYVREYINQRGALNEQWIIEPPTTVEEEAYHNNMLPHELRYIPDIKTFKSEYIKSNILNKETYKQDAVSLAVKMLSNPECWFEQTKSDESGDWSYSWGNRILNCLHFIV